MHKSQPAEIAARNQRIVALAAAGMRPKKIAAEYGVTHGRICQILRAARKVAISTQPATITAGETP